MNTKQHEEQFENFGVNETENLTIPLKMKIK